MEARHANYLIESSASGEGVSALQRQGKSIADIFKFHASRLSELEDELKKHFYIVLKE